MYLPRRWKLYLHAFSLLRNSDQLPEAWRAWKYGPEERRSVSIGSDKKCQVIKVWEVNVLKDKIMTGKSYSQTSSLSIVCQAQKICSFIAIKRRNGALTFFSVFVIADSFRVIFVIDWEGPEILGNTPWYFYDNHAYFRLQSLVGINFHRMLSWHQNVIITLHRNN